MCTSNVCRGPVAAALFKRRSPVGCGRIVRSAGIEGVDGLPVVVAAQTVAHKRGVDLSHHESRIAPPHLLPAFDLILAMEARQRDWIERNVPAVLDRTWLLGHWRNLEITRPSNGHYPDYERIAHQIDQCLDDWGRRIEVLDRQTSQPESDSISDSRYAY